MKMRNYGNRKQLSEKIISTIEYLRIIGMEHLFIFRENGRIRKFIGEENMVSIPNTYLYELKNAIGPQPSKRFFFLAGRHFHNLSK